MTSQLVLEGGPARVPLRGTYNLRTVGPFPSIHGAIQAERLYRSDALHALDDAARNALAELGIRRIVDLRSDAEVAQRPDRLPANVDYVHHPLLLVSPENAGQEELTLPRLYQRMVEHDGRLLASAVALLSTHEGAVLVHCTAGKDRTGLVVALALLAAGASTDDVITDYAQTEAHLVGEWTQGMLRDLARAGIAASERLVQILNGSPAELMADTIRSIETSHGSAQDYLLDHGLAETDLDALIAHLTTPRP
ncbi:tyrosine-protein phosphatase [Salinibacterium sp. GXW1014]|uniref:tyrosine-protein phosphatase n=1 Tax=Salinibacterium sp. GXW1014 TaxID=3377838 RepID=UPI00383A1DFC